MTHNTKKQCLIIFGATAVGKTHLSEYAATKGWHWIEGDDLIEPDLKEKIIARQATEDDLAPFFDDLLAYTLKTLETEPHVVMSQGLARKRFRKLFRDALPTAKFIFIDSPMELAKQRAKNRGNWADESVVENTYRILEYPENPDYVIDNVIDGEIPPTFDQILERYK